MADYSITPTTSFISGTMADSATQRAWEPAVVEQVLQGFWDSFLLLSPLIPDQPWGSCSMGMPWVTTTLRVADTVWPTDKIALSTARERFFGMNSWISFHY